MKTGDIGTIKNMVTGAGLHGRIGSVYPGSFNFTIDGSKSLNNFYKDDWDFEQDATPLPTKPLAVMRITNHAGKGVFSAPYTLFDGGWRQENGGAFFTTTEAFEKMIRRGGWEVVVDFEGVG